MKQYWGGQAKKRNVSIAYATRLSGLVNDLPESLAFYQTAFAHHPEQFVTYSELRKMGDLLGRDALASLGLRANLKLSAQFLATLNGKGRRDPLAAASVIGLTISTALCTLRDLERLKSANANAVRFYGSNMAAGPCSNATVLDGRTLSISEAMLLPLESCSHPDQCGCRYQASPSLIEDFD